MKIIVPVVKVAFSAMGGAISAAVNNIAAIISGLMTVLDGITTFISGVFTGNWSKAWEGVKTIFKGVFESLAALCKAPINAVIGIINGAIAGINKLNISIPDWVPGIGGQTFGINIPTIPMLYKGADNWKGGTAVINDRGGEIVDLPKGSRVYPHDKSVEMAKQEGTAKSGSVSINIQKIADKIEVRSDEDIDRIAEALAYKLKNVAFNTGTA
jgi:phage-related protein